MALRFGIGRRRARHDLEQALRALPPRLRRDPAFDGALRELSRLSREAGHSARRGPSVTWLVALFLALVGTAGGFWFWLQAGGELPAYAGGPGRGDTLLVLIVGNGDYGQQLPALPGAEQDAVAIARELAGWDLEFLTLSDRGVAGFNRNIGSDGWRMLHDRLRDEGERYGAVLLYYSGHGVQERPCDGSGAEEVLHMVMVDADAGRGDCRGLISVNGVLERLGALRRSLLPLGKGEWETVMVYDACRTPIPGWTGDGAWKAPEAGVLLTASQGGAYSLETPLSGGRLTRALLHQLRIAREQDRIGVAEWFAAAGKEVVEENRWWPPDQQQRPKLYGEKRLAGLRLVRVRRDEHPLTPQDALALQRQEEEERRRQALNRSMLEMEKIFADPNVENLHRLEAAEAFLGAVHAYVTGPGGGEAEKRQRARELRPEWADGLRRMSDLLALYFSGHACHSEDDTYKAHERYLSRLDDWIAEVRSLGLSTLAETHGDLTRQLRRAYRERCGVWLRRWREGQRLPPPAGSGGQAGVAPAGSGHHHLLVLVDILRVGTRKA